jgi:hypothetical protein
LNLRGGLPGKAQAVPIDCGFRASTISNIGPNTVYYRSQQPVDHTTNDGSILAGDSQTLQGTQFFVVDEGTTASRLDSAFITVQSGLTTDDELESHEVLTDQAHSIGVQISNRVTTPLYTYNSASPNLGATQSAVLDPIVPHVIVGTLNQNLTVTYSNFVQGAAFKIIGKQDGSGSHTVTLTDGTTTIAVTVASAAGAKFTIEGDVTDSLTIRVRAFSASATTFLDDWVLVAPTPPNPGVRENRGPGGTTDLALLPTAFTDLRATGTVNPGGGDAVIELAGYATAVGTQAALSVTGFSPVPFIDNSGAALTPVALVNSKGELTGQQSAKARVLQQVGVPIKPGYAPNGTSDDPYTAFTPGFTVVDNGGGAGQGLTYTGRLWDTWRLRPADTTYNAASSHTATRSLTGLSTTSGLNTVRFPTGAITTADSGMTIVMSSLPSNTYVVSVAGTTATMSTTATANGSGLTGTIPRRSRRSPGSRSSARTPCGSLTWRTAPATRSTGIRSPRPSRSLPSLRRPSGVRRPPSSRTCR